jgi:hypothetical protein
LPMRIDTSTAAPVTSDIVPATISETCRPPTNAFSRLRE